MKIESIIKRKAGTTVEIGDMTYFFNATDTEPRHLCEVTNQSHIDRFLSIKDGYRVPEGEEVNPSQESTVLLGSSLFPSVVTIAEGIELPLGDIVRGAFEYTGMTISEWNALDEDEREAELNAQIEFLRTPKLTDAAPADEGQKPQTAEGGKQAEPVAQETESAPATEQNPAVETKELNRDALLAEAKALKIKSPHLFGNEKLAAAIAAAKASV